MEVRWSVPKKAGAVLAALLAVVITYQIVFALRDRPSSLRGARYYNEDMKQGIGAMWKPGYLPDTLGEHMEEVQANPEGYLAKQSTAVPGAREAPRLKESGRRALEKEERKEEQEWELDILVEDLLTEQESSGVEAFLRDGESGDVPVEEMEMDSVEGIEGLAEVMERLRSVLRRHLAEAPAGDEEGLLPLPRVGPLPGLEAPLAFCKERPVHDSHTCFHMVGHALADYGHTVPEECLYASADEGCLHGFAERWFALYGGVDGTLLANKEKALRIASACAALPDDSRGDCLHAAAHFLMEDLDSDLHAVLAVCKEMSLGEAVACGSGAYMLGSPAFSSTDGLLASPCLQALLPWECLRYGAQYGARQGLRPMHIFNACQQLEEEAASREEVLACYFAFGDFALFPFTGGVRGMTPIDIHAVHSVIEAGDERLKAMLFGGRRTISLLPIGDYKKSPEMARSFCSSHLERAYFTDNPHAAQMCSEIVRLPVHCVYCETYHRSFLPNGVLGQLAN